MKRRNAKLLAAVCIASSGILCSLATSIIDEQFEAGYDRLNNNIAGGNMAVYKGRSGTVANVSPGALAFDGTLKSGADQFWGYFTDPGANVGSEVQNGHVTVGVGQQLSVAVTFSLSTMPVGTTYSLRFGVFDDSGTRQTTDLASGGSSAAFNPNPGYALFLPITAASGLNNQLSIRNHTAFQNNIFNSATDFTQIGSTVGGAYNPLSAGVDYTLNFSIARIDAATTELSASLVDTTSSALMTGGSVSFTGTQQSSFDWLAWRIPNPDGGGITTFKRMAVDVTAVPEPATATLMGLATLIGVSVLRRKNR
jgi:hypothetical protein